MEGGKVEKGLTMWEDEVLTVWVLSSLPLFVLCFVLTRGRRWSLCSRAPDQRLIILCVRVCSLYHYCRLSSIVMFPSLFIYCVVRTSRLYVFRVLVPDKLLLSLCIRVSESGVSPWAHRCIWRLDRISLSRSIWAPHPSSVNHLGLNMHLETRSEEANWTIFLTYWVLDPWPQWSPHLYSSMLSV